MAKKIRSGEVSVFEDSIAYFEPHKGISPPEKKKKIRLLSLPKLLVIILCGAVFAYCISELLKINKSNQESTSLYDNIYNDFADVLNPSLSLSKLTLPIQSSLLSSSASTPSKGGEFNTIEQNQTSHKFQQVLSKLEKLNTQNEHIVGYISVSGTAINYPILQCEDNDFYLNHAFDKSLSKPGSIFYDFRNSSVPDQNNNLIVYGHNMLNGSMFNNLMLYIDNEPLFKEGTITVYSFEGIYTYKIFSLYHAKAYDDYLRIGFNNDEDYVSWINERAKLSMFDAGIELTAESKIISLSTCINYPSDNRLAVHGVLVNVER